MSNKPPRRTPKTSRPNRPTSPGDVANLVAHIRRNAAKGRHRDR